MTFKTDVMYYVYIVRCVDGSLYTGITLNPQGRIKQHNGETAGGAKYTRSRQPVALVYTEKCASKKEAFRREGEIKALTRVQKEKLIVGV
jgi:putative endonuclease